MRKNHFDKLTAFLTRKGFMTLLAALLAAIPLALVKKMIGTRRETASAAKPKVEIPANLPPGASIHDRVIVYRENESYLALSSRCPHLGCRIDTLKDGVLMCPCHGSTFTQKGELLSGPALKNLTPLTATLDAKRGVLIVEGD